MSNWKWQIAIIVPAASRDAANAMASVVAGHEQTATFAIELSPTGLGQATHYACCTWATDEWLGRMQSALPTIVGAAYYRMDALGTLVASSSAGSVGELWSWPSSIHDVGLKVVNAVS